MRCLQSFLRKGVSLGFAGLDQNLRDLKAWVSAHPLGQAQTPPRWLGLSHFESGSLSSPLSRPLFARTRLPLELLRATAPVLWTPHNRASLGALIAQIPTRTLTREGTTKCRPRICRGTYKKPTLP